MLSNQFHSRLAAHKKKAANHFKRDLVLAILNRFGASEDLLVLDAKYQGLKKQLIIAAERFKFMNGLEFDIVHTIRSLLVKDEILSFVKQNCLRSDEPKWDEVHTTLIYLCNLASRHHRYETSHPVA